MRLLAGLPVDTNNLERLNEDANAGEAVCYLLMALRRWGATRTLNFQRGGTRSMSLMADAFAQCAMRACKHQSKVLWGVLWAACPLGIAQGRFA